MPSENVTNQSKVASLLNPLRIRSKKLEIICSTAVSLVDFYDNRAMLYNIAQNQEKSRVKGDKIMEKSTVANRLNRLEELKKEIVELGPVMRGSVVIIGTRNKQPYFSLNKDKKTRLIYLGKKREAIARTYSENYRRLLAIIEEMTEINMELVKNNAAPEELT